VFGDIYLIDTDDVSSRGKVLRIDSSDYSRTLVTDFAVGAPEVLGIDPANGYVIPNSNLLFNKHPPVAQDDTVLTLVNIPINIDVLADNGNGADFDPDGDTLAITSVTTPPNGNAAIIADGGLLQTFNNPTPEIGEQFGISVSINGNNVLVGATFDDTGGAFSGTAYLYDSTTGNPLQTIPNPTPESSDKFGESVSIDGNNVLVGAIGDNTGAVSAGSAYLFDATTGNLLQTFNNPTPITDDLFGTSVSIDGNNVLVGAFGDDTGASNAGSAYLFDITTCDDDTSNGGTASDGICEAETQIFNNPTPETGGQFGESVSIDGNNVLVGAIGDDAGASNAGSAYLFDATTGNLPRRCCHQLIQICQIHLQLEE